MFGCNRYCYGWTDLEIVKSFTPVRFQNVNFTCETRINRDIFGQIEDVLLIYFQQIDSFCAIMYSDSNSLKLLCEKSSLNLANFTNRVIFRVKSWKFYLSPKTFYTSATSATCDNFHVCFILFQTFTIRLSAPLLSSNFCHHAWTEAPLFGMTRQLSPIWSLLLPRVISEYSFGEILYQLLSKEISSKYSLEDSVGKISCLH